MLKTYSELFKGLLLASDLCFVSMAWWCAFLLRFHTNVFVEAEPHVLRHYMIAWLVILGVWAVVFELCDFYRPRRLSTGFSPSSNRVASPASASRVPAN